jgi:uncharacterized protein YqhQ
MRFKQVKYGGMALFDGVTFSSLHGSSVATLEDGTITYSTTRSNPDKFSSFIEKIPIVRGACMLAFMLFSFIFMYNGKILWRRIFAVALGWTIGYFLPGGSGSHTTGSTGTHWWMPIITVIGGLALFLSLLLPIAILVGLKFSNWGKYHGAEHKVGNCHDKGVPMTIAGAMAQSRIHKRCGTNIAVLAIIINYFSFPFFDKYHVPGMLACLLVFGVSVELIKLDIFTYPGRLVQKLITTREPDAEQIEVALIAFEALRIEEEGTQEERAEVLQREIKNLIKHLEEFGGMKASPAGIHNVIEE